MIELDRKLTEKDPISDNENKANKQTVSQKEEETAKELDIEIKDTQKRILNDLKLSDLPSALEHWDYRKTKLPNESFVLRFTIDAKDFAPKSDVWNRFAKKGIAPKSFCNLGSDGKLCLPGGYVKYPNNTAEEAKHYEYYMSSPKAVKEDIIFLMLEPLLEKISKANDKSIEDIKKVMPTDLEEIKKIVKENAKEAVLSKEEADAIEKVIEKIKNIEQKRDEFLSKRYKKLIEHLQKKSKKALPDFSGDPVRLLHNLYKAKEDEVLKNRLKKEYNIEDIDKKIKEVEEIVKAPKKITEADNTARKITQELLSKRDDMLASNILFLTKALKDKSFNVELDEDAKKETLKFLKENFDDVVIKNIGDKEKAKRIKELFKEIIGNTEIHLNNDPNAELNVLSETPYAADEDAYFKTFFSFV